jgi:hypothetical protein
MVVVHSPLATRPIFLSADARPTPQDYLPAAPTEKSDKSACCYMSFRTEGSAGAVRILGRVLAFAQRARVAVFYVCRSSKAVSSLGMSSITS